jgi:DnaJ like chaperone protein
MGLGSWVGKLIGAALGLLLSKGSLLGMFVGGFIGHQFDKGFGAGKLGGATFSRVAPARRQQVFFESLFLAMGHLAKADGHVSEAEVHVARTYMHAMRLSPENVRLAINLFTRGKEPNFPIDQQIRELNEVCQGQPALIRNFLEVLMDMALLKRSMSAAERELLWRMAAGLGVGRVEMAQFEAVLRAQRSFGQGRGRGGAQPSAAADLEQAYKALGVTPSASDKEVKTAYRRLMNQHHPDKLVARGLPDSMMEVAKERTREIRKAYETVRDHRGMK